VLPGGIGNRCQIENSAGSAERRRRMVHRETFFGAGPASSLGPALFTRADCSKNNICSSKASARLQVQKRKNRSLISASLSAFEVLLGPDGQG
jgi:hypothetical protein